MVTGRRQERIDELAERYGVETTLSNAEAVSGAGFIVIAVKPQDFECCWGDRWAADVRADGALGGGRDADCADREASERRRAGAARDAEHARDSARGVAGLCAGAHANGDHLAMAQEVLEHVGRVVQVPEPYMDAVTAVSGSGPAYFALLAEAMIEAGILLGLSREVSTELVVQTMFGTAKLLRDEQMHPVELREMR